MDTLYWLQVLAAIAFFILLGAAIFMVVSFYWCNNYTCKAFQLAGDKAEKGTKEYTIALLNELYNDGIWPLPYIGAAILTPLTLWLINADLTVRNFAIMFLISFLVIYFLFAFLGHHYIKFISQYTIGYIQANCNSSASRTIYDEGRDEEPICYQTRASDITDNNNLGFRSYTEGLDITFATPVNIF